MGSCFSTPPLQPRQVVQQYPTPSQQQQKDIYCTEPAQPPVYQQQSIVYQQQPVYQQQITAYQQSPVYQQPAIYPVIMYQQPIYPQNVVYQHPMYQQPVYQQQ